MGEENYNIIFARLAWNSQRWRGFDIKGYENKAKYKFRYVGIYGVGHEWWNFFEYPGDNYYGSYGGPSRPIKNFKNGLILFTSQSIFDHKHYLVGFYSNAEYGEFPINQSYYDSLDDITKNKILNTFTPEEGRATLDEMRGQDTPIFKAAKDNSAVFFEPLEFIPNTLGKIKRFGMNSFIYVGDGALISKKATKELLQTVITTHKSVLGKPEYKEKIPEIKTIIQKTETVLGKYFSEEPPNGTVNEGDIMKYNGTNQTNDFPKQTILYGPPGTGKTYSAFLKAYEILFNEPIDKATFSSIKKRLIESGSEEIDVSDLTWVDAILLAFDELGSDKATVTELKNSEIIKKVSSFKNRERNISNTLWSILQQYSLVDSKTVKYQHKNGKEIFDKDESSKWFIADSGKEYFNTRLSDIQSTSLTTIKQLSFVTFHQSYSYEDFIEGYRPVKDEDTVSEIIGYDLHDGIFKKMCNLAKEDPENNYVLIIDEINRGNISKIFGELITLIEDNKRIGGTEEIIVTLPYSGDEFGVPSNVYIIGTMNSTDKSIALVDIALRRRFKFEKIFPDYSLIHNTSASSLLEKLNEKICALKNSDFVIGHSYFMRIPDTDENNEKLKDVFISQVLPLIEEYFYNDWEALATLLGPESIQKTKPVSKMCWNELKHNFEVNNSDDELLIGRTLEDPEKIFNNIKSLYFS